MQNENEYVFDINQAITATQIVHEHVETNANFFKNLKSKLSLIQFQTSRLLDEGYRDSKWFVHNFDFDECEWINEDNDSSSVCQNSTIKVHPCIYAGER